MSKLVGYARVSTQDQDLKLQIDALLKSSKKLRLTTRFIIIYRPETVTFCWIAPAGPLCTILLSITLTIVIVLNDKNMVKITRLVINIGEYPNF